MDKCPHFDLMNPDTYIGGAPREIYRELRQNYPVYRDEKPDQGMPYWAITKQKDLDFVGKHPELFSSWQMTHSLRDLEGRQLAQTRLQMISMDPPNHIKYRRIVRQVFGPKMMDSYTKRFQEIAHNTVMKAIADGECDFVEDIARDLPLIAICELMGVPIEDRGMFFEWTNIALGADDPDLSCGPEDVKAAVAAIHDYARKLIREHKQNAKEGIVGTLLEFNKDGEKLTDDEFCSFFLLLLVAGNETTRNVTSHAMRLFIEYPVQYQKLLDDHSLLEHAIEEVLRYNPAVIALRRTATRDVEVGGQLIKKGDKVVMYFQAASNDEDVFENPDLFDITRPLREDVRNGHRAFGIGEHFCLGSHLARLELKIILMEVIKHVRNPRLNGKTNWLRSFLINGIKSMPIKFDVA